jgi:hypothetical protein
MKAITDFAYWLAAPREPEPYPTYLVEPIILGPDGWMVFENPTRSQLEARFAERNYEANT